MDEWIDGIKQQFLTQWENPSPVIRIKFELAFNSYNLFEVFHLGVLEMIYILSAILVLSAVGSTCLFLARLLSESRFHHNTNCHQLTSKPEALSLSKSSIIQLHL